MKKFILNAIFCTAAIALLSSCSVFELDNKKAPSETLKGSVTDVATGEPVLTDQGSEGIRVRITELSYGDNVEHNPDFYCRPDGTYQNTKIFKGHYNVRIDGPFIPIVRENAEGEVISDESVNTDIDGTTVVDFKVQPFLKVGIVGVPQVSNGKITAQVRVTRGVSKEEFREKVEPMGNYEEGFVNVTDVQLFVSYSSTVGYRAKDDRWSSEIKYSGDSFEELLGQDIEISSNGNIPSDRKVFIRAAARINYATPVGSGTKRWNYSEVMEVAIP